MGNFVDVISEYLPEKNEAVMVANTKRNCILPLSALAFFALNSNQTPEYRLSIVVAFAFALIISSQISSVVELGKSGSIGLRVFSMLSAIGICITCSASAVINGASMLALVAIPFVYLYVLVFVKRIKDIFISSGIFKDITKAEAAIYSVLILGFFAYTIITFIKTQVFYGTEYMGDIIYTSDSPDLVKGKVYALLCHTENDLRQPLFAVFAAPFLGIAYLIKSIPLVSDTCSAILVNCIQLLMMFTANFMLARMMKLTGIKRICFMLLTSMTYTSLLFALMMEQYIVGYFWLVLCVYMICDKKHPDRLPVWGACGTLLTSGVFLLSMSDKNPVRDFWNWLKDMIKYGVEFVVFCCICGRFDVFCGISLKFITLGKFSGVELSFSDKLFQYTEFVKGCFIAPDAGINSTAVDYVSWQLRWPQGICVIGVVLFVICAASAVLNSSQISSRIAAGWILFSAVVLIMVGWGTKENGLILYSLYFGWAFLVLLFQFAEYIETKLKTYCLIPILTVALIILLSVTNIPAIREMIQFATEYYPA